MAPGATPSPQHLPARDMAPRLEWVFPLRWHPLMQRLRALLQDHVLTSPVLSPAATQASPWQAPGRRAQPTAPARPWTQSRALVLLDHHSCPLWAARPWNGHEELCWALAAAGCVPWTSQ